MRDIPWPKLIQVRERHKQSAIEKLAEQRRECAQREAQLRGAQAELEQRVAAKAELWERTRELGAVSIAQLGQASAWSRALDVQVAQAAGVARAAEQQAQQERQRLLARRRELQTRLGELDRAQQMAQRARDEWRRGQELRQDDEADEAALQRQTHAHRTGRL